MYVHSHKKITLKLKDECIDLSDFKYNNKIETLPKINK